MSTPVTTDWRETTALMHEALRDACTAAIEALLNVSDALGNDFQLANAIARLERERSDQERAIERLRARLPNGAE